MSGFPTYNTICEDCLLITKPKHFKVMILRNHLPRARTGRTNTNFLIQVMRLTGIFLLAACLQVSASGFGQTVTLSADHASLETVMNQIKAQTGFSFFYNAEWLRQARPVTANFQDLPITEALEQLFREQPLTFSLINNTIVLKLKPSPSIENNITNDTPPGEIHGRITTPEGVPLSGANVVIKRTKTGTQTNAKGEFTLQNIKPDDILEVSYIGYRKLTVKVAGGKDFPLVMEVATNALDKVVIQAYGNTSQRLTTGDIGTVSSVQIERQPIVNPLQ